MKPLVLIHALDKDDPRMGLPERFVSKLKESFKIITYTDLINDASKLSQVSGAVASPTRKNRLEPLLDSLTSLKAVATLSVGIDHIPLEYLENRNIPVGNCPTFRQRNKTVADYAILLMLSVKRNFMEHVNSLKLRHTEETEFGFINDSNDVTNLTMGIVGMGRIGEQIAKRAKAFDMKIVYHNRTQRRNVPNIQGLEYYENLHDMLPFVDVLVIACSLNSTTVALISEKEFALMKKSSIIINIARGKIVDTESLVKALQSNQISGAGLDVTDPEPLPAGHSLYNMGNVVVTPHSASHTVEAIEDMFEMCIANLRAALIENKTMPYSVKHG